MAQQVVEMTSDEAKLLRGMQRVIDQQAKLQAGFKKTGDESKKVAPGNEGLKQIEDMAVGWLSVSSAIAFATNALRAHNEEKKRGLASVDRLDDSNRRLSQIATSDKDLAEQQGKADSLSTTFGLDRTRTRQLLFAARSEGFEGYAADAARFDPVVSMEAQATTAGQIPTLFDGRINSREATALTLAAAEASRLDFESVAKSLPTAVSGAAQAGSSPEETLALLSSAAGKFKSGDTAAERIKTLGLKLSLDDQFKGKGVVDALKRFQADPELRQKFAGDSIELNEAINSLTPLLPTIEERTAMLSRERKLVGSDEDILERKLRGRLADPEFVALQKKRAAEIKTEIAGEDAYAVEAGESAATKSDIDTALIDRRADPLEKLAVRGAVNAAELASDGDSTAMNAAAEAGQLLTPRRALAAGTLAGPMLVVEGAQRTIRSAAEGGLGEEKFNQIMSTEIPVLGETLRLMYGVTQEQLDEMRRQRGNNNAAANGQAGRHIE